MTQEQFYHEACLRAMQGLLAASGEYTDELIVDPPKHMANAAQQYAEALTDQVFPSRFWEREEPPYDGGPDVSPENYFADPDNWDLP
jgi:hypothetical protein